MNSFWWGQGRMTHCGINWLSWKKLSMHKSQGCMGFKDMWAFNLAMLGKQWWNFQTKPETVVSRIFKVHYFPNRTYLTASMGHNPSYVWRSILHACFIICGGARWSIGSGACIPILDEPWLHNGERIDCNIHGAPLDPYVKSWNEPVVRQVFSEDLTYKILNTPLFEQFQHDKMILKAEKNGRYSVCSAYQLCVIELVDLSHLHRLGILVNNLDAQISTKG